MPYRLLAATEVAEILQVVAHPRRIRILEGLRGGFDGRLTPMYLGSQVTTNAGLLAYRALDEALGPTGMASDVLTDSRQGCNEQHGLSPLLRQSIYSRLAGYENVNDAERLCVDPAIDDKKPLRSAPFSGCRPRPSGTGVGKTTKICRALDMGGQIVELRGTASLERTPAQAI